MKKISFMALAFLLGCATTHQQIVSKINTIPTGAMEHEAELLLGKPTFKYQSNEKPEIILWEYKNKGGTSHLFFKNGKLIRCNANVNAFSALDDAYTLGFIDAEEYQRQNNILAQRQQLYNQRIAAVAGIMAAMPPPGQYQPPPTQQPKRYYIHKTTSNPQNTIGQVGYIEER